MRRHEISDDNWLRIEHLLPGRTGGHGGVAKDNRRFINAVWYVAKTGIPWRDLPERFGKWDTVFHRFNEWCKRGVWKRVFEAVRDPDLEWLMIDSTVIRAHHHAAGMNGGADDQALGRSWGGFGEVPHEWWTAGKRCKLCSRGDTPMAGTRKVYTPEFKLRAVKMSTEQKLSVAEVARRLGVTENRLHEWKKAHAAKGVDAFTGCGRLTPLEEENRKLRAEVKRLEMGRDIRTKATAFFASQTK